MPNLLPQPPEIVGPIGSMFWFSSLNKDTQQMIGILLLLSQLILLIAALAYIANFVLRIKKHVWDKWFVAVTLLLLPALPFLIAAIIITPQALFHLIIK